MTQTTELALPEATTALEVFSQPEGLDAYVEQAREFVRDQTPDVTTAKGRKAIASTAAKVSKLKVRLDDLGKDLVADWKQKAKAVDNSRRSMREQLDALRDEARAPLTEWEDAEKERVERIEHYLSVLRQHHESIPLMRRDQIASLDRELADIDQFDFEEKQASADVERERITLAIERRIVELDEHDRKEAERIKREEEQAAIAKQQEEERQRLEDQRLEQERIALEEQKRIAKEQEAVRLEREQIEREKAEAAERVRIAEERERQAKADAEAAAQRERDRIEAERIEAERLAAEEKQSEADKKEAEARQKKMEAEAKKNREELHAVIAEEIAPYCKSKPKALALVRAIDQGLSNHLQVVYF